MRRNERGHRATTRIIRKITTFNFLWWPSLFILTQFNLGCAEPTMAQPIPVIHDLKQSHQSPLKPFLNPNRLFLRSGVALVMDGSEGTVLFNKNIHTQRPIASLTKLMTAMVILDAHLPLDESITITKADRDRLRGSKSKLSYGTKLTRQDLLKIALAASENRAAAALARTFPGGKKAFVAAMNQKAGHLGMNSTQFRDAAGLHSGNVSTAADLSILLEAVYHYPLIPEFSTLRIDYVTDLRSGWKIKFMNTNRLVRGKKWDIDLSKTGYIADAGHCIVMLAHIDGRPIVMVLLNSWGKLSKFGDANRIKKWLHQANQKALKAKQASNNPVGRRFPGLIDPTGHRAHSITVPFGFQASPTSWANPTS